MTTTVAVPTRVVNRRERVARSADAPSLLDVAEVKNYAKTDQALSPLGERLQLLCNRLKCSWSKLANLTGLARATLLKAAQVKPDDEPPRGRQVAKVPSLTTDTLKLLWRHTNVNLHWLITGEGDMGDVYLREEEAPEKDRDARIIESRTERPNDVRPPRKPKRPK